MSGIRFVSTVTVLYKNPELSRTFFPNSDKYIHLPLKPTLFFQIRFYVFQLYCYSAFNLHFKFLLSILRSQDDGPANRPPRHRRRNDLHNEYVPHYYPSSRPRRMDILLETQCFIGKVTKRHKHTTNAGQWQRDASTHGPAWLGVDCGKPVGVVYRSCVHPTRAEHAQHPWYWQKSSSDVLPSGSAVALSVRHKTKIKVCKSYVHSVWANIGQFFFLWTSSVTLMIIISFVRLFLPWSLDKLNDCQWALLLMWKHCKMSLVVSMIFFIRSKCFTHICICLVSFRNKYLAIYIW